MILKNMELETVCGITSTLPVNLHPEFAFAGRSNVGKSSLINGLLNRKSFARTSSQPGKTQTINFYHINDALYFVDLPGYGYAKVSVQTKEKWAKMINRYLNGSAQLQLIFLLLDIRHEPTAQDKNMLEWILANKKTPVIIATKLDKINRSQIQTQIKMIRQSLKLKKDIQIIPFSALTKQGRDEIWTVIESHLTPVIDADPAILETVQDSKIIETGQNPEILESVRNLEVPAKD